jgi:hypothetical protein
LQIYVYIAIISLSFISFALILVNLLLLENSSKAARQGMIVGIISQGINCMAFVIYVILLFPLRRQLGWDMYKIVGADVSQISNLLLLMLEMWRTYQWYAVAQKSLAIVVASVLSEFLYPNAYNYKDYHTLSICFYVVNVILFVWLFISTYLGICGAKRERKLWLWTVIIGLALQIVVNLVELIFATKFPNMFNVYYTFGKENMITCRY